MKRILKDVLKNTLRVVIIKGNPEKMKGQEKLAESYYREIADFVEDQGFSTVFDPGEPMTCPDSSAMFWIAHSRGVDRIRCIDSKDQWRFLKFGDLDGVIHPKDAKWQKTIINHVASQEQPPKEHFKFTDDQKKAIVDLINRL